MKRWLIILVTIFAALYAVPAGADDTAATAPPREQLQHILDQPLYQRWRLRQERQAKNAPQKESQLMLKLREWMENFGQWLRDLFKNWKPRSSTNPSSSNSNWSWLEVMSIVKMFGWIVLGIVVIAAAYMIYRALRGMERGPGRARVLSRDQVRKALEDGHALAMDTPAWLAEADRLLSERDPRAVYRALYLALLSGLHQAGKINFRKNRTNWIYVRSYQGPPDDLPVFTDLTEMFDNVWYGLRPAESSRIDRVKDSIQFLLKQPTAQRNAGE